MATYTNRPICEACQLAELKNRGLVVNDDNRALDYLGSINYFRFACYLQPFELDTTTHQYAAGTSFDQIGLFTAAGFEWGGDWTTRKDFQHFEWVD